MRTEATALIAEDGRVAGVRLRGPEGERTIPANLVLCADGRHSAMRAQADLHPVAFGAPMDVLWFRLPRRPDEDEATAGHFGRGRILVTLDRGTHWQCAYVVPKDGAPAIRARGLAAFRGEIGALVPFLAGRTGEIASWEDVKVLTVALDRLERWHRPGLLCIGDAAHAMSPVGGVGINLAIQDAVAAANLLAGPLRAGTLTEFDLARVQARRMRPVRLTQGLQRLVQDRVIARVLDAAGPLRPPLALRLLDALPPLQRLPARVIGLGFRPERVAGAEGPQAAAP